MSEIRVTSVVGENGGNPVGLTTGFTVGPLTGTTGIGATITHHGHAQFAGVCTATSFVGSGANLTGVSAGGASNIAFNAGKGIDYSAQTVGGIAGVSVTSELFDHYEEGTFTPFLSAASSAPSVSYGAERGGKYTRIGNMVFYSIGMNIASYSGGSGNVYIGGFPYVGSGDPGWDGAHVFRDCSAIGLNSRTNTLGAWMNESAVAGYPILYIQSMSSTSTFGASYVQASSMSTGRITVHGQYKIG